MAWSHGDTAGGVCVVRVSVRTMQYVALRAAVAVDDAARATIGSSPCHPAGAGAVGRAEPKFWYLYVL